LVGVENHIRGGIEGDAVLETLHIGL
jgi:hypothetical protein